jgi:hypothetical protein
MWATMCLLIRRQDEKRHGVMRRMQEVVERNGGHTRQVGYMFKRRRE